MYYVNIHFVFFFKDITNLPAFLQQIRMAAELFHIKAVDGGGVVLPTQIGDQLAKAVDEQKGAVDLPVVKAFPQVGVEFVISLYRFVGAVHLIMGQRIPQGFFLAQIKVQQGAVGVEQQKLVVFQKALPFPL